VALKGPRSLAQGGRKLQLQRAALFAREPLCRECIKYGRISEAVIRDHIVPLAEGGSDDDDNIQPLCRACSDAKTATESARGRGGRKTQRMTNRKPIPEANFYVRGFQGWGIALAYCNEARHCFFTITRAVHVARRTT
jgi:5-methylcytosine-specific restriction endonuclease McrA